MWQGLLRDQGNPDVVMAGGEWEADTRVAVAGER